MKAIVKTDFNLPGQVGKYVGKVRDVYDIDGKYLVMVVTDRISAFDVVLPEGVPYKGQVLNRIAAKFLDATADILPNWKVAVPDPAVTVGYKCEPFKVEMVIRGYLAGHAWREYKAGKRAICGVPMPDGMVENQKFPEPLVTPTSKAAEGHDEDISKEEIIDILNLADQLKYETKHGIEHHHLKGKCLAMIFEKSSTRTRVSFEVGINQLGGYAVVLAGEGSQIGRGEPVQDTARVLSRYVDGIMIRTFEQKEVEDLAKYGSVPVINGLTDFCHPCQILADLMTIREYKGSFDGLKMCFIGDGNNMMNSLIVGGLKVGMEVAVACPEGYRPPQEILDFAAGYDCFTLTDDPMVAAKDADVVITDVWTSMGQEEERAAREKAFAGYCIDEKIMGVAKSDAIVQHCLPAHRGEEITEEVFEANAGPIFDEAENRLHAQKAVMVTLMKD